MNAAHRNLKMNNLSPKQGAIAYCQHGYLGFITSKKEGSRGWTGIHISPGMEGLTWHSKRPKVVGYNTDLVQIFENKND